MIFRTCKFRGWMGECLSQSYKFSLEPDVVYTFDAAPVGHGRLEPWSGCLKIK